MKTLLALLAFSLTLSCAKTPYNFLDGKPKLNLKGPRMAMVGHPITLTYTLLGVLPAPDEPVAILVKIFGELRASTVTPIYQRVSSIILVFNDLDYYEAMGKLRGNAHGDTWVERSMMDPEQYKAAPDMEDDSGTVYIDIEVWRVDPHPEIATKWVRTNLWARARWMVKLECPHCLL